MNTPRAAHLLALIALAGCAPEVIDLAMFGLDAGAGGAPLDAGAPGAGELDAEPSPALDAALDTGRAQVELDARVRADADRLGGSCTSKDDCAAGQVCDISSCGANAKGTCMSAPECDDKFEPVCGCNGFKYLNDCERRRNSVARDRDCALQRPPCTGEGTCPTTPDGSATHCGFSAQRTMNYQCTRGERACFVLPPCPGLWGMTSSRILYSACDPAVSAIGMGLEFCTTACDAILSGHQFAPAGLSRCLIAPARTGGAGGPGGGGGFPGGGF